tara:strand:+ start:534 stop:9743 length:9210 start_codon:yes stop_codon:yes gene_type:complete
MQKDITAKQYAASIRKQKPDLYTLDDDALTRRYLEHYPDHKGMFGPEEIKRIYSVKPSERGSDTQFSVFQAKEMVGGIPSAAVGGLAALTGNKKLLDYSEELRAQALENTRERMKDPELLGYLNWMEKEPVSLQNFYQPAMFQRGFAQAAPSIAAMLAIDVGLNALTLGVGGTVFRNVTGGLAAIAKAKKGSTAIKGATTFAKAQSTISTVGTMGSMGAMEGSEQYNSTMDYLLEQGVDAKQANKIASISGAVYAVASGIFESLPYGRFKKRLGIGSIKTAKEFELRMAKALGKTGAWQKGKTITKEMITQASLESGTEEAQLLSSKLLDYYVKRGYEEVPESVLQYLKDQVFTTESKESAYSGAVMGLTMGTIPGIGSVSQSSRVKKVLNETKLPEGEGQDIEISSSEKEINSSSSKIKIRAFIGSYDNMTVEEKESAEELNQIYREDLGAAAKDVSKELNENFDEIVSELTEDDAFDLLNQLESSDNEIDITALEMRFERFYSKIDLDIDEVSDNVNIEEEVVSEDIDEVPEQKEILDEIDETDAINILPKKKKPLKSKKKLEKVNINYDKDTGKIEVLVNDEIVTDLKEGEIDKLQSGLADAENEEGSDYTALNEAKLEILNRLESKQDKAIENLEEKSLPKDEITDEPTNIDEPIDEQDSSNIINISPKKETLSRVRIEAKAVGVENVKSYKDIPSLKKQIKIKKDEKTRLEAVEAKTKALNPEVFEDEEVKKLNPNAESYIAVLDGRVTLEEDDNKVYASIDGTRIGLNDFELKKYKFLKKKANEPKYESGDSSVILKTQVQALEAQIYKRAVLDEGLKTTPKPTIEGKPKKEGALLTEKEQLQNILTQLEKEGKAKETPKGQPTLNSGGAQGADTIFEEAAMEAGHEVEAMSFDKHDTKSKNRKKILPSLLQKADKFIKKANETLGRTIPNKNYVRNLLRRNYYQVKDVNQVIAVGHLTPLKNEVRGGTGWAVQMAIDLGRVENKMADKDIHVFNLAKNEWTKWDGKKFVKAEAPSLSNNYAGIGARPYSKENLFGITKEGEAAIKALYEKPRKLTNQEKAMGFEEGDIEASIAATEKMENERKQREDIELVQEEEKVDKELSDVKNQVEKSQKESKNPKEKEIVLDDTPSEKINTKEGIFKERQDSESFTYTKGQITVLNKIATFIESKVQDYFVFAGYAGTGKTTIVENISNFAKKNGKEVYILAPTNKAIVRLEEKSKNEDGSIRYEADFSTLHSKLYGAPDENGIFRNNDIIFDANTVVIIDESSMIGSKVLKDIQDRFVNVGAKVIMIGDGFQLPPVLSSKENDPNIMGKHKDKGYQIKEVVRQAAQSGIIKLATLLRIVKHSALPTQSSDDVIITSKKELEESFYQDIANGISAVMIVAVNRTRNIYNNLTRKKIWGDKSKDVLNNGETLIAINNSNLRSNGEIFTLPSFEELSEPMTITYTIMKNRALVQKRISLYAYKDEKGNPQFISNNIEDASLHASMISKEDLKKMYSKFPDWMKLNNKSMAYELKDLVNINTYGYSITAHKSQGSEWDNVYLGEVNTFGESITNARWLYTAITRAAKKLYINEAQVRSNQAYNWTDMDLTINNDNRAIKAQNNINEKLQEISSGQSIDNNKELAAKIVNRLKKQFPNIDANAVERVYDRFGREVAGRALDGMVEWSLTKGTLDTVPHEYAHIYIDLLRESPIVKMGINKFRLKDENGNFLESLDKAEERLVQYMGEYYANRIQEKSLVNKLKVWLKQFWLNIKKPFNKMNQKQIGDYLAEKFYQDSIAKQTTVVNGKERLQEIPPSTNAWYKTMAVFDNNYNDMKSYLKDKAGFFNKRKIDKIDDKEMLTFFIEKIIDSDINGIFKPVFEAWKNDKGYSEGIESKIDFITEDSKEYFIKLVEDINLLLSGVSLKETDLKQINKLNAQFRKNLGILTNNDMAYLATQARKSKKKGGLEEFYSQVEKIIKVGKGKLTDKQKKESLIFRLNVLNSASVNRPLVGNKVSRFQDKIHHTVDSVLSEDLNTGKIKNKIILKIKTESNAIGKSNPQTTRLTIIEHMINLKDLEWLNGSDIEVVTEYAPNFYNPMGSTSDSKQKYNSWKYSDILAFQKELRKKGFVLVLNRGEHERYGITKVTKEHKESAKNALEYWESQVPAISKKQINNFLGEWFEAKATPIFLAEEIARHEMLNKIFPNYLNHSGQKVFKRVKIPLTPAIVSDEMPSHTGYIYDKNKATFVVKDSNGKNKTVDSIIDIDGKKVNILDGTSLSSKRLFINFAIHFGMDLKSSKAKTILNILDEDNNQLMVKHQHFIPPNPVSIYENYGKDNEKLIAIIDDSGNIKNENGDIIDVLMTDDEAKVYNGKFKMNSMIEIQGKSIGLLTMGEKRHDKSRLQMQLYNYIHDKAILKTFETKMMPLLQDKLRKAFLLGRALKNSNSQKKISEFIEIISGSDNTFPDTAVEMFKANLGLHKFGRKMIDKLVQTQIVEGALNFANMPGLTGDTLADYTGNLEYKEVGIPLGDSSVVIEAYMKASKNDKRTFSDIKKEGMDDVNNWLKTANFQLLISRSPVPHIGGAAMVRVKYLHNSNGQIHLNPLLLIKDLEGDGDGDKVNLEKLPKELENEFIRLYKDLEVKSIDLNKYKKNKKDYDLSHRKDLYNLIEAITYGQKAIAEIANTTLSFGVLQETFNFIEMNNEDGTKSKIKIRNGSDIITDVQSKISGTVDNLLRIYLQAAADNVEFLLLTEWEYNTKDLYRNLFYKETDGKSSYLNENDMLVITQLMGKIKSLSDIKRGKDFEKSYSLKDTLEKSSIYNIFIKNKDNFLVESGYSKTADVSDVSFKTEIVNGEARYVLHPHEMVAVEPSRMYDKYKESFNDGSPYFLHDNIYFSAHLNSVSKMQENMKNILSNKDVYNGVAYGKLMGNAFGNLFTELETEEIEMDGWSSNAKMIAFSDKYLKRFNKLNKDERIAATYSFLEGYKREIDGKYLKVAEISSFPPYSLDPLKLSLLDATVMVEYNDYYNKFIQEEISREIVPGKLKRDFIKDKITYDELNKSDDTRIIGIENIVTREQKDIMENC